MPKPAAENSMAGAWGFGATGVIGQPVGMTVTRLACSGSYARPAAAPKPGASAMPCMRGMLRADGLCEGTRGVAPPPPVARTAPTEADRNV